MVFGTEKNSVRIDFFAHKYVLKLISFLISRRLTIGRDEKRQRGWQPKAAREKQSAKKKAEARGRERNDQRVKK